MNPELQELYDSAERKRQEMIERIKQLPEEARALQPSEREWSPLQVAEHCRVTEALYEELARETKPEQLEGRRATRHLMLSMIRWSMRRAIRAPTMPMFEPQAAPPIEETEREWAALRSRLAAIVEGAEPDQPVLIHKMFGPMSGRQILEIMDAHMDYHLTRFPRVG
jgi:hypothetical protein